GGRSGGTSDTEEPTAVEGRPRMGGDLTDARAGWLGGPLLRARPSYADDGGSVSSDSMRAADGHVQTFRTIPVPPAVMVVRAGTRLNSGSTYKHVRVALAMSA